MGKARVTLEEITNAARSVRHAANRGDSVLFESNADMARRLLENFIREQKEAASK